MIQIVPLLGIGEIAPGCDLADELGAAVERQRYAVEAGDILVVTQKIVSKAEGRFVSLRTVSPSERAGKLAAITLKDPRIVELVLRESSDIVRAAPNVLIARHHIGVVLANAGIDRSNLGTPDDETVLLLPADPDASARELHAALETRWGASPAILVSDSFGRPWRQGVVNVAIGAFGLPSLIDRRGELDRNGRRLEATQIGFADLIASAAGLAMGEGSEGVPAVLVKGAHADAPCNNASSLVRPLAEDLFR
ncbi:MAG: F420-0--gamma-glutamyl ligase [Alphaproteobacteria bacterium]|nr:F420-0--gamma-glutamyl ligase [Alphaproteobacteria bacterium]